MGRLDTRWAEAGDARAVAEIHVASWRAAYTGLIDESVLDGLDVDYRAARWSRLIERTLSPTPLDDGVQPAHRLLVAEAAGRLVGWASFGTGRDPDTSDWGEVSALYVHPDCWSRGAGHLLLTHAAQDLHRTGHDTAYLWALRGNDRAAHFYERHGWAPDGVEKVGAAGGARGLHENRYVRELDGLD